MGFADKEKPKTDVKRLLSARKNLCAHLDRLPIVPSHTSVNIGTKDGQPSLVVIVPGKTPEIVAALPERFEGYLLETLEKGPLDFESSPVRRA